MTDDDSEVAQQANEAIQAALTCEDRGVGLKPRHVYVDESGECQCGRGPVLDQRRMR